MRGVRDMTHNQGSWPSGFRSEQEPAANRRFACRGRNPLRNIQDKKMRPLSVCLSLGRESECISISSEE